jgi:hypothetical protein
MNSSLRFAVTMLRMNGGMLIWGLHFGLVYGVNGIVCARELADVQWFGLGIMTWVVVAATVVALAATLVLIGHALRAAGRFGPYPEPTGPFIDWITATVGAVAVLAIVWDALPVLFVPACG